MPNKDQQAHLKAASNIRAEALAAGCVDACQLWWSDNILTGQTRFVHTDGEESSHLTVEPYIDATAQRDEVQKWLRGLHQ